MADRGFAIGGPTPSPTSPTDLLSQFALWAEGLRSYLGDRGFGAMVGPPTPTGQAQPVARPLLDLLGTDMSMVNPAAVGSRGVALLPKVEQGVLGPRITYLIRNALGEAPFRGRAVVKLQPEGPSELLALGLRRGEENLGASEMVANMAGKDTGFGTDLATLRRVIGALGEEFRRAGVGEITATPASQSRGRLFGMAARPLEPELAPLRFTPARLPFE